VTGDSGRAVWLGQACSYVRGADAVLAPLIEPGDAERDSIIAQATELKGWPPEIDDQVLEEDVRVARAAAVLAPARTSNVRSDLRDPHLHIRDWLHASGDRAMGGEDPAAHALTVHRAPTRRPPAADTACAHLAYRDAAERQRIRTRTIATGAWAPNTHAGRECGSASRTSSRFRPPSRRFASWHGRAAPAAEPPVIHHTSGGHE
jgi:hypothetical protein